MNNALKYKKIQLINILFNNWKVKHFYDLD